MQILSYYVMERELGAKILHFSFKINLSEYLFYKYHSHEETTSIQNDSVGEGGNVDLIGYHEFN